MLNIDLISDNLKNILSKKVTSETLKVLAKTVNYTGKDFSALDKLIRAIKLEKESENSIYCITKLQEIKLVLIKYYFNTNGIPEITATGENVIIGEYLEWLSSIYNAFSNVDINSNNFEVCTCIIKTPLIWGKDTYRDYLTINTDSLQITRNLVEDK